MDLRVYHYVDDIESDSEKTSPSPGQPPVIDLSEVIATTIFSDHSEDSSLTDDLDNLTDVFDPCKTDLDDSGVSQDQVLLCGDKLRVRHRSVLSSIEVLEFDTEENDISIVTNNCQPLSSTPATMRTQPMAPVTPGNKNNSFVGDSRFNDSLSNLLGSPPPESSLYNNPFFNDLQAALANECTAGKTSLPQSLFDALTTQPNSDVFSREQMLQQRFNNLLPAFPDDIQSLSNFYHHQASEVETERFCAIQQKDLPSEVKYSMNFHYDSQLHQIMDRVEQSLMLLEKTEQMSFSGRPIKPRPLLSKRAVQLMEKWYDNHLEHPYPNTDIIEQLATAGNIAPEQVKKWFANKRNRSNNTRTLTEIAKKKRQLALKNMDCYMKTESDS